MRDWRKDSDDIYTAVTSGCKNFTEARRVVVEGYVKDERFTRTGIAHALKRLEAHYAEQK